MINFFYSSLLLFNDLWNNLILIFAYMLDINLKDLKLIQLPKAPSTSDLYFNQTLVVIIYSLRL